MNKLTINTQSRNELNISIIFAAMTLSLIMIFRTELIAEIGATFFNLLPLLPLAFFCLAFYRHHQRSDQSACRTMSINKGAVMALAVVFMSNFNPARGLGSSEISTMVSYSFFAAALVVLLLIRRARTC
jgi:hypothetical protein